MNNQFYQVGGSLPANSKTYIKREADTNLYNALKESKYCYILNARQVGKSSLRVQTSYNLVNDGYKCVNIDITNIGAKDIKVEEWYFSLVFAIIEQLELEEDEFFELWDSLERLTIINRFAKMIDKILDSCPNNIVIFIDEIDSILGIDIFSTDDFFAVIRTFYNMRSEDKKYNRLSFAIFGVSTAEDLMKDSNRTPFNIAHNIKLTQLNRDESTPLLDGLENQNIEASEILDKVFDYTDGTPYLTQKILEYISTNPIDSINDIDKIIKGFEETNISNIQNRIISDKKYNIKMLNLISNILNSQVPFRSVSQESGNEGVITNDSDLAQIYLKLSGLVKNENGYLVYNNEIYKRIFTKDWIEEQLSKIDRPFAKDLNRWLKLNKDKSALIKGEVLDKAIEWSNGRDDLNQNELIYINRSIEYEQNRKFKKDLILIIFISILIFIYYIYTSNQKNITINIKLENLNKELKIEKKKNLDFTLKKTEDGLSQIHQKALKILFSIDTKNKQLSKSENNISIFSGNGSLIDNNISLNEQNKTKNISKPKKALDKFYISKEFKNKYSELIKLIYHTESMDDDER